jgi:hypothetical protein
MALLRWNRKYARGIGGKRLFEGNGRDTRWIVSDFSWQWMRLTEWYWPECQDANRYARVLTNSRKIQLLEFRLDARHSTKSQGFRRSERALKKPLISSGCRLWWGPTIAAFSMRLDSGDPGGSKCCPRHLNIIWVCILNRISADVQVFFMSRDTWLGRNYIFRSTPAALDRHGRRPSWGNPGFCLAGRGDPGRWRR